LIVHAHGLMDNPYHLVIETPKGNPSLLTHGCTFKETAKPFGMHYATAGRLRKLANDKGK
jgi:hypothetical protein